MSEFNILNDSPYFSNIDLSIQESIPDFELTEDYSLIKLRKISKNLVKNNFLAVAGLLIYIDSIVGGELKIGILDITDDITTRVDDKFKDSIIALLEKTLVGIDINRELSLAQITEQIISSAFTDGDILINLPMDNNRDENSIQTYVELIDASRIKTPPKERNNNLVREGVEYWSSGRLKGYHVIKNNPTKTLGAYNLSDTDFTFLPVYKSDGKITRRVCYLFKAPTFIRVNQSRQYPVMTGTMQIIEYFHQYLEAVLIGARVAACFSAFVETSNPEAAKKSMTESGETTSITVKGKKLTKLQPGLVSYLRMGEKISFASPNKPSDNFDPFILRLLRFISSAWRIPYEKLCMDLSIVNYSSWRGGSLEADRNFSRWRRDLTSVLKWIILTFLREGLSKKLIKGNLSNILLQIVFPKYKSLDEEKSARAKKINLITGTVSKKQIVDEEGGNFEALQKELDTEIDLDVDRKARELIRQKKWQEKENIIFNNTNDNNDSNNVDGEEAKERRKEDGNW